MLNELIKPRRNRFNHFLMILLASTLWVFWIGIHGLEANASEKLINHSQSPCTYDNFSSFFEDFSENIAIQNESIAYPLKKFTLISDGDSEPRLIEKKIDKKSLIFPVLPNKENQKKEFLNVRFLNSQEKNVQVILEKPDSGYQVRYFFIKNNCWKLFKIEDWSI